jgi:hypothetical protein
VLFIFGVAAALVAGKLAGGRAERLTGLGVRWWWAAPIALLVQLLVVYGPPELVDRAAITLIVASHAALLAVALRNWRLAGATIAALGVAMNLAVMLANGGLMPVAPETLARAGRVEAWKIGDGTPGTRVAQSKDVILPAADTWLEPLSDRYWTGLPGRLSILFSAGDVVLLVGVMFGIVRTMTYAQAGSTTSPEEHHDRQPTGRARLPEATTAG